jgi:two-component system cell cycle sensor histidine kinase/response regulator CckA
MTCDSALLTIPQESPARKDLSVVIRASERAAALTKQLLAFSRQQVLELRSININDVVTEMEQMLKRLIGETITVAVHMEKDLYNCDLDAGQINQVLINLVLNARDAMPQGGVLTIKTSNINLSSNFLKDHPWMKPGPHVEILIRDTGKGIPEELLPKIFDPFFTTKGIGEGTGLGLFTTYGIVKQTGGGVFVSSAVGEGTAFKLFFPSNGKGTEPLHKPQPRSLAKPKGTVLLVEDEVELRKAIKVRLERSGLIVIEVENPMDAVELVRENPITIDLIVADVVMPQMSGPDLIKIVREIRPSIKTLLVSGYLSDTMEEFGVVTEFSHFLPKPFKPEDFVAKVVAILEQA